MSDVTYSGSDVTLSTPTVIGSISAGEYYSPYLAYAKSGQTWMLTDINVVGLLNEGGKTQESICTEFYPSGIATGSDDTLFLTDQFNKCVWSISDDRKQRKMFQTNDIKPVGICCLLDGNFIISFPYEGRVIHFQKNGEVNREYDKNIFTHPWDVATSKDNETIFVTDKSSPSALFTPGKVIALSLEGKVKFEYTGDKGVVDEDFTPVGLCVDGWNNLLITDYNNNCVHMINMQGGLLRAIPTQNLGVIEPRTISADGRGVMWVGGWADKRRFQMKVILIKYLSH